MEIIINVRYGYISSINCPLNSKTLNIKLVFLTFFQSKFSLKLEVNKWKKSKLKPEKDLLKLIKRNEAKVEKGKEVKLFIWGCFLGTFKL